MSSFEDFLRERIVYDKYEGFSEATQLELIKLNAEDNVKKASKPKNESFQPLVKKRR